MKTLQIQRIRTDPLQHKWPEPAWIAELQESHRPTARLRFFLNLAAAYHSESGALTELSESCGLNRAHLNVCRQRGRVSPEIAVRLEDTLGRDTFPRELFNDIFAVAER